MKTTIIYYTDNSLPDTLSVFVQEKLKEAACGKPIVSVSQKPIYFGHNICIGDIGRSHLSMYKQLLAGGEAAQTEYIALAEHDCLYTFEHFDWIPENKDTFFYNINHWFVQWDGKHKNEYSYFRRKVLSQLICHRDIFLKAVSEKVWMLDHGWMIKKGKAGACEPGVVPPEDALVRVLQCEPGVCDGREEYLAALAEFKDLGKENGRWTACAFGTERPNLDIRHDGNFSGGRRYKRKTTYDLPYWGRFEDVRKPTIFPVPKIVSGVSQAPRPDLSIIIPSRQEMFLSKTIENILENIEANTEIIAILDGAWADPVIADHPRVILVHHTTSIGQRAATNEGVRISRAKFVMKCDAHCAFDKGFDAKLMSNCEHDWTVIPRMFNLHAFNWKCKACGNETYQGPIPTTCKDCGDSSGFERVIYWKRRISRRTDFTRFDNDLHFQYWPEYEIRREANNSLADVMGCLGACFFMHRERYIELEGLDEKHGSWGQLGTEVSCKSWLSGGRQIVNKNTWFSHMFRTQPGFSFPYPLKPQDQEKARQYSRHLWLNDLWPQAKRKLSWLIDKFAPIPTWKQI